MICALKLSQSSNTTRVEHTVRLLLAIHKLTPVCHYSASDRLVHFHESFLLSLLKHTLHFAVLLAHLYRSVQNTLLEMAFYFPSFPFPNSLLTLPLEAPFELMAIPIDYFSLSTTMVSLPLPTVTPSLLVVIDSIAMFLIECKIALVRVSRCIPDKTLSFYTAMINLSHVSELFGFDFTVTMKHTPKKGPSIHIPIFETEFTFSGHFVFTEFASVRLF